MNILQKIFSPGSTAKKKTLLHGDLEVGDRQSRSTPKPSAPTRIKRKSTAESSADDLCGPLMQSVSMTVHSDPVPTSFKTNSSFANHARPTQGPASPKSLRLAGSLSNMSSHVDRHQQHSATLVSSVPRHSERSLFDKKQGSGSFAAGDTAVPGGSFAANGGTVNLWRLPWTQQKVIMCSNCHRPRQRGRSTYISRAHYTAQQVSCDNDMGDDISEANDDTSYSDSEDMGGPTSEAVSHCRCGITMDGDVPREHHSSAEAAEEQPEVFVVETRNSNVARFPGTMGSDSDSDGEGAEGLRRSFKLSLVSSLTSSSLRRRAPHAPQALNADSRHSCTASVPKSVSHWLHEQQTSEAPAMLNLKAAR
ncbi:hypothetical protein GH5_01952 [Leishmania sp. Ghana 2012 LV757]|uniref:hypothetical protein n=1 Tax=Leishmania sp. Ghana 2012 LV757 TaxID=2803181 RepID=UPI001B68D696|nr:hypothetical protein GH5_01952 [Leishmania sp. Ghana 2012 LV757]